jgi:hypothetical protein
MLPPEPDVLLARQAFCDAQAAMVGALKRIGDFSVGWYGTDTSDERGSFAVVNASGPLIGNVGDYLHVVNGRHDVFVYVIGSKTNLLTDLALTRRSYQQIQLLAVEPTTCKVDLVP